MRAKKRNPTINLSRTELEDLEPVKEKLAEAKQQLLDYQTGLTSKYGDELK